MISTQKSSNYCSSCEKKQNNVRFLFNPGSNKQVSVILCQNCLLKLKEKLLQYQVGEVKEEFDNYIGLR